jgi:hypothetical protein
VETIVVFRKFKDNGNIIALFPYETWNGKDCTSYMHVGQHGAADYTHCLNLTKLAKEKEYISLKRELEKLGYNLKIRKRVKR